MQATSVTDPRPFRLILAAAVLLVLLLLATAGLRSYRDLAAARGREAELQQRIEATQEHIDVLTRRLERLEDDPVTLERLAREELWMARPGDVVIVLPAGGDDEDRAPAPAVDR